jgi:Fe-S cluster biogenesis protein NfuA
LPHSIKKTPSPRKDDIEKQVKEVLDSMYWILEAHDSTAEIAEIKDNKVVITLAGQCAECDTNCIEDAIYQKLPDIELIFR